MFETSIQNHTDKLEKTSFYVTGLFNQNLSYWYMHSKKYTVKKKVFLDILTRKQKAKTVILQ